MRVPINNYWVADNPANIMFDQEMKGCLIGLSLNDACILCRNILNCQTSSFYNSLYLAHGINLEQIYLHLFLLKNS